MTELDLETLKGLIVPVVTVEDFGEDWHLPSAEALARITSDWPAILAALERAGRVEEALREIAQGAPEGKKYWYRYDWCVRHARAVLAAAPAPPEEAKPIHFWRAAGHPGCNVGGGTNDVAAVTCPTCREWIARNIPAPGREEPKP